MPLYDAARKRHEHQIKLASHVLGQGNTFDDALFRVASRWRGLDWFTDDQLAEIRAEMIHRRWYCRNLGRAIRKRRTA